MLAAEIVLVLMVAGLVSSIGVRILISNRADRRVHEKNFAAIDACGDFIWAEYDFVEAVLRSHPELVRYDEELRTLVDRVIETREQWHRLTVDDPHDGWKSPLREFLY